MVVGAHAVVGLLLIFLPELAPLPPSLPPPPIPEIAFVMPRNGGRMIERLFCRLLLTCRLKWTKTDYFKVIKAGAFFASCFC
jgi:hypothetical protein